MARAPNDNLIKAHELYKQGMLLVEIANQLKIPVGTIRSWKKRNSWEENSNVAETVKRNVAKVAAKEKKSVEKKVNEVLEKSNLTEKQKMFCLYYNKSFNATQSYLKAYECSYESALGNGCRMMENDGVRAEIMRLKEIKRQSIMITEDDIIEKYMKIAFADMTDFVEFGEVEQPIITDDGVVKVYNDETDREEPLTEMVNVLRFKNSKEVDGSLICEISHGKNGSKVKLEDRQKALDWLAKYFMMDPMDKHRVEFDEKKLELERLKANTDNNDKTINIIHNVPRPKKAGEE